MTFKSAIYSGTVLHKRVRTKQHKLTYRVYSLLFDLDELELLNKALHLFGYNRWAPIAFFDKDHGEKSGLSALAWVKKRLKEAKIQINGLKVTLLCYPRVFGYVFNPISVYFCFDKDGNLRAILYEVANTFKECHTYVFELNVSDKLKITHSCKKKLYVSPFIKLDTQYHFSVTPPRERFNLSIRQEDRNGPILFANFSAKRLPLTDLNLVCCLLKIPFMTVKVILGIHWEALILWLKGLPVIRHTASNPSIQNSNYNSNS